MNRRVAAVLVGILLFGARQTAACSAMNWDPNDLVENTPVFSANGRFCAVVRHYEGIADFTAERAGKVFRFDDLEPLDDVEEAADAVPAARRPVIAALYETGARRTLLAEIPLDAETAGSVLVSDSGRFLVVTGGSGGGACGGYLRADDPLVLIHTVSVTGVALCESESVCQKRHRFDSPSQTADGRSLWPPYEIILRTAYGVRNTRQLRIANMDFRIADSFAHFSPDLPVTSRWSGRRPPSPIR